MPTAPSWPRSLGLSLGLESSPEMKARLKRVGESEAAAIASRCPGLRLRGRSPLYAGSDLTGKERRGHEVAIQPNARSRKVVVPVRHIPEDGVIDGSQRSHRRLVAVPRTAAVSAGRFNRTAPRRRTLLERAQIVSDGELPDLASHPCGRLARESEVCARGNTRRRHIIDDRGEVRERASDARTAD